MQIHEHVGHASLVGWREKTADIVAPRASKRGPLSEDQTRAIIGGAFFVASLYYVVATVIRAVRANRD